MTKTQKEELKNIVKSPSTILFNESMKKYTSFKIGGTAEALIKACNINTVEEVLKYAKEKNIPITIIGNGSNILVLDEGIEGITLKIDIQKLEINLPNNLQDKKVQVIVGAGNKLIEVSYKVAEHGLVGMEELSSIPGTIGGAIYMNAGAYGKEMKNVVKEIIYLDEKQQIKKMTDKQAEFEYRHSIFQEKQYVILEVTLQLERNNKNEEIKNKMQEYADSRKKTQPIEFPNAGSTFKRGKDFITAKLIDECGLKGHKIGGAQVSTKHAGFIVNTGNATAQDVLDLAKYVQRKVYEKIGKKIELEMKIIGTSKNK